MHSTHAMKSGLVKAALLAVLLCFLFTDKVLLATEPAEGPPLPMAVSNNAVAISYGDVGQRIFSFMGIGPKKTWDAVTTRAYELNVRAGTWAEKRPVPGVAGRLGASAVAIGGQVFIFGGYVLDDKGQETTLGDVNVYVPFEDRYYRGKDLPVPVEDAVVGLFRERYIYVIGGRSKGEAVGNVQVYDTLEDRWMQATPMPTAVFGHAGAISGDTIVYVDGAVRNPEAKGPKFVALIECGMGRLPRSKKGDITKIEWTKLPAHPGTARFRIGAGADPREKKGGKIYFSGGTGNPYDYNGVGYDGQTAEPSAMTFAFDVRAEKWETVEENTPEPTMDHRGLLVTSQGLALVGGMEKGQRVTGKVTIVKAKGGK